MEEGNVDQDWGWKLVDFFKDLSQQCKALNDCIDHMQEKMGMGTAQEGIKLGSRKLKQRKKKGKGRRGMQTTKTTLIKRMSKRKTVKKRRMWFLGGGKPFQLLDGRRYIKRYDTSVKKSSRFQPMMKMQPKRSKKKDVKKRKGEKGRRQLWKGQQLQPRERGAFKNFNALKHMMSLLINMDDRFSSKKYKLCL